MERGGRGIPYMGFIVDPYCFFLSYPVTDRAAAEKMLPERYELVDTAMFSGDPKRPQVIISAFTLRTSVFAGMRVECYLIARDKAPAASPGSSRLRDEHPDQRSCERLLGLFLGSRPLRHHALRRALAEAANEKRGNRYAVMADMSNGRMRELDRDLWVEGNMAVDYGGRLMDPSSRPFSLIFDPILMKQAQEIPLEAVTIRENSFMSAIIDGTHPRPQPSSPTPSTSSSGRTWAMRRSPRKRTF
jgi:hypothetical protein